MCSTGCDARGTEANQAGPGCHGGCSQSSCQESRDSSCINDVASSPSDVQNDSNCAERLGRQKVCVKCKSTAAQVLAKQQEPLCWDCFHVSLGKTLRKAVRLKGLVGPGDRVLVAISGGFASTALLRLLKEMCNSNMDREERGQIAFQMGAVYVDDALAHGGTPEDSRRAMDAISALHRASAPDVPLDCVQLEDIFDAEDRPSEKRRDLLVNLLQAVEDVTGHEDLIESLRNALLLRVAARLGYNKVSRGDCATRVAVRTIASAAKGAGFALPASIQHFDARAGKEAPAVICPVRDLPMKDLALLCHHLGASAVQPPRQPLRGRRKPSLNTLAEGFVAGLQSALPSTVPTILRTALKLQAFPWNHPSSTSSRGRGQNGTTPSQPESGPLCGICSAPFSPTETSVQGSCISAGAPGNEHARIEPLADVVQKGDKDVAMRSQTGDTEEGSREATPADGNAFTLCRDDGDRESRHWKQDEATRAADLQQSDAGFRANGTHLASLPYCLVCQEQILLSGQLKKVFIEELLPGSMRIALGLQIDAHDGGPHRVR